MMEVKRVIFYIRQYGYTELEWVMPLLHSYQTRKVEVTVLLPTHADNSRKKLMTEWVKNYSDHIVYGPELFNMNWMLRIRKYLIFEKKPLILNYLSKVLLFFMRRLGSLKIVSQFFNHYSTKEVRQFLDNFDIIYCPEGSYPREMSNELSKLIFISSKLLKKPLVGYLKSTYSDIRDLTTSNMGLDLLLVLSENDKDVCEKAGLPAIVLGAQRFKDSWIIEMSKHFSQHHDCIELKRTLLNKLVALILLKNRTGLVQKDISIEAHLDYRKKMFQSLIEGGFHLLIKPHPSDNSLPLEKTLEALPDDSFTISEMPAQYLANISLCSVCEMPSNSLMDSIAAGKKTYWPYPKLIMGFENLRDDEVASMYAANGFPGNFIRFVEMKCPEINDEFALSNNLLEQFNQLVNTHIEINDAISACEQAVLHGIG